MRIKMGRTRIVLLIPFLHVVLKFPRVYLLYVLRDLVRYRRNKKALKKLFAFPVECWWGFRDDLFGGLVANVREYQFYKTTRHQFLQPTYLSLGFVNIQRYDAPCNTPADTLWTRLYEITNGGVFRDSHAFANPNNFSLIDGKLRIFDYASKGSQSVIKKYGRKIIREFKVS